MNPRQERAEGAREYILTLLHQNRQVSVADLAEELGAKPSWVMHQLRILREAGQAHRLTPIALCEQFQQVGQVWAIGPAPDADEADAVPLQISRHHGARPTFHVSMLERLLFPSYGVMA